MKNKHSTLAIIGLLLLTSSLAYGLEFRSVQVEKATVYDAPSSSAKKLFLLGRHYPVEVIVDLKDWLKVRDALGGIYWIEAKHLHANRTAVAKVNTMLRNSRDRDAPAIASIEKNVLLDLVDTNIINGLVQVKHRDGLIGFVPVSALWGVN